MARAMMELQRRRRDVVLAIVAMSITLVTALVVLEIWRADLGSPSRYRDDGILNLMLVKATLDNGWYHENPSLGAPLGQELYDYPVLSGDHLNVVLFKLLGLVTDDAAVVLNLFFLLTFPLVTLTAFVVMRRLGIGAGAALVCASLYALLPYHFLRGETHFLLSAYYAVPPAAYLVLAVLRGQALFARRTDTSSRALAWVSPRTLATIGICALVTSASGSFYYAGFTAFLLAGAAVVRFALTLDASTLATGGATVAMIIAFSASHAAPTLLYWQEHGPAPDVLQRQPHESEFYSLKLTQLILPTIYHRFWPFAKAREIYDSWGEAPEPGMASLGALGALGLVALFVTTLASAIDESARRRFPAMLRAAGVGVLLAFLVATTGGFSSLIALVFFPGLRGWDRLSIFIAFFALLAVAAALDHVHRRLRPLRFGRPLFAGLLAAVFVLGVLDQTSPAYVPPYEETTSRYRADRDLVRAMEQRLPANAAVFQLPYASFPEANPPPPGRTVVYDALRPYVHSDTLRWSFGAVQGRPADWAAQLADEPLREVVPVASAIGFDALFVDRMGYDTDTAAATAVRELERIIGRPPVAGEDGRLLFFDLREYNDRLRERLSSAELAELRAVVPPPDGS